MTDEQIIRQLESTLRQSVSQFHRALRSESAPPVFFKGCDFAAGFYLNCYIAIWDQLEAFGCSTQVNLPSLLRWDEHHGYTEPRRSRSFPSRG